MSGVKYRFTGTEKDLFNLGFKKFDGGFKYDFNPCNILDGLVDTYLIISKENEINLCVDNKVYAVDCDAFGYENCDCVISNQVKECYSENTYEKTLFKFYLGFDILFKLCELGLIKEEIKKEVK